MDLVIRMISSVWFWVDIVLAVSGGLVVWRGLKIEKEAERLLVPSDFKPDIFEDVIAPYKAKVERGWRILMIGIVMEVIAAFVISIISGLEIADANAQAAKANERVSTNEVRVAQLESDAARLVAVGENAKKAAAEAIESAEKAKKEREVAEAGRLELEKQVLELKQTTQPREISLKQLAAFINSLQTLTNKEEVLVICSSGTSETRRLSRGVRNMLDEAGFWMAKSKISDFGPLSGSYSSGVIESSVMVDSDIKPEPWVYVAYNGDGFPPNSIALYAAFKAADIPVDMKTVGGLALGKLVVIVVGKKQF